MLDHEHRELNESDLLISRMIDDTSSPDEFARFETLAGADPALWRELALRQGDARRLDHAVATATAPALDVRLPRSRIMPSRIGWPLAMAGWAAVLIIGFSWLVTLFDANRPDPGIDRVVTTPRLTPEAHFEEYLRAPYVLGDLEPEIGEVKPMPDGRVAVNFIRRIEEVVFLNPEGSLPLDERGELVRSATELRRLEQSAGIPNAH